VTAYKQAENVDHGQMWPSNKNLGEFYDI
jgi:hypothetical protein